MGLLFHSTSREFISPHFTCFTHPLDKHHVTLQFTAPWWSWQTPHFQNSSLQWPRSSTKVPADHSEAGSPRDFHENKLPLKCIVLSEEIPLLLYTMMIKAQSSPSYIYFFPPRCQVFLTLNYIFDIKLC